MEEGEPAFDYRKHMQHLDHQLGLAADDVAVSEDELVAEQIRIARLQSDRDELGNVNYDMLVAARQGLKSLYKRGGFELAHVSGKTPEVPDQLIEQLGQTVKLFRQPAVQPRSLKVEGFSVDLDAVADSLETGAVQLRGVFGHLSADKWPITRC